MPMSVVYTTVNGQILCENRGGVVSHFVSDPLGSVVMVRDNSGNTVYEAEYDPYGNVQSETGTNPSEFGYVGTLGYVKDSAFSLYVRARYLLTNLGRWLTKDPLWPSEPGIVYAGARPSLWSDPSGNRPMFDDCTEKTARYCQAARDWGHKNYGLNCFCRVSNMVCDFIFQQVVPLVCKKWAACINKCLFDCVMEGRGCSASTSKCWGRLFSPPLGSFPGSPCNQIWDTGCIRHQDDQRHDDCCRSMVLCEQEQLGYCNSKSGSCSKFDHGCSALFIRLSVPPFPFGKPDGDRQAAAYNLCCKRKVWREWLPTQPRMDPMPFGR